MKYQTKAKIVTLEGVRSKAGLDFRFFETDGALVRMPHSTRDARHPSDAASVVQNWLLLSVPLPRFPVQRPLVRLDDPRKQIVALY